MGEREETRTGAWKVRGRWMGKGEEREREDPALHFQASGLKHARPDYRDFQTSAARNGVPGSTGSLEMARDLPRSQDKPVT